ncbi:hypothetical protein FB451DRAFT_80090 [Mycena latifolia]|nr:hypothetical protein FB451DRAFT_80090 [Mycena latifolia]
MPHACKLPRFVLYCLLAMIRPSPFSTPSDPFGLRGPPFGRPPAFRRRHRASTRTDRRGATSRSRTMRWGTSRRSSYLPRRRLRLLRSTSTRKPLRSTTLRRRTAPTDTSCPRLPRARGEERGVPRAGSCAPSSFTAAPPRLGIYIWRALVVLYLLLRAHGTARAPPSAASPKAFAFLRPPTPASSLSSLDAAHIADF